MVYVLLLGHLFIINYDTYINIFYLFKYSYFFSIIVN